MRMIDWVGAGLGPFIVPVLRRRLAYRIGSLAAAGENAIATTATEILGGNDDGHWEISNGYLVPTADGDTADLSAGPYKLKLNNRTIAVITILDDPVYHNAALVTHNGDQIYLT